MRRTLVASAFALALVAAACGGSEDPAPTAVATPPATATAIPTPTPLPPVVLTAEEQAYLEAVEAFEDEIQPPGALNYIREVSSACLHGEPTCTNDGLEEAYQRMEEAANAVLALEAPSDRFVRIKRGIDDAMETYLVAVEGARERGGVPLEADAFWGGTEVAVSFYYDALDAVETLPPE